MTDLKYAPLAARSTKSATLGLPTSKQPPVCRGSYRQQPRSQCPLRLNSEDPSMAKQSSRSEKMATNGLKTRTKTKTTTQMRPTAPLAKGRSLPETTALSQEARLCLLLIVVLCLYFVLVYSWAKLSASSGSCLAFFCCGRMAHLYTGPSYFYFVFFMFCSVLFLSCCLCRIQGS